MHTPGELLLQKTGYDYDYRGQRGGIGELVHARSGYHHDLRKRIAVGEVWQTHVDGSAGGGAISDHVKHGERTGINDGAVGGIYNTAHQNRNGDMYPTHGLGPMAKCMDVNRGNRFVSLTSTASKSRGVAEWAVRNLDDDHPNTDTNWRCGDVVTTVINCANGETILLQYDISLPDPVTDTVIRGTQGSYDRDTVEEDYYDEYLPSLWECYEDHGVEPGLAGSDYLVLKSFVESV